MHSSELFRSLRKPFLLFMVSLSLLIAVGFSPLGAQSADAPPKAAQPATVLPKWQYGFFAAGGFPPNYQIYAGNQEITVGGPLVTTWISEQLYFWNAGFIGGRMLSALHGPTLLRGRAEAMLEIMPFWMARYPRQTPTLVLGTTTESYGSFGPKNFFGASATPVLFRWNFQRHSSTKNLPWAQVGGGLLWTNHKFPYEGNTSVINFTPQLGFGYSRTLRRRQSLDLALKLVHISSAGLGDQNPGIQGTLQFSAGYSWWK